MAARKKSPARRSGTPALKTVESLELRRLERRLTRGEHVDGNEIVETVRRALLRGENPGRFGRYVLYRIGSAVLDGHASTPTPGGEVTR